MVGRHPGPPCLMGATKNMLAFRTPAILWAESNSHPAVEHTVSSLLSLQTPRWLNLVSVWTWFYESSNVCNESVPSQKTHGIVLTVMITKHHHSPESCPTRVADIFTWFCWNDLPAPRHCTEHSPPTELMPHRYEVQNFVALSITHSNSTWEKITFYFKKYG